MQTRLTLCALGLAFGSGAHAMGVAARSVTVDNFVRAESDTYATSLARDGGIGKLAHRRELASIDNQTVIRFNRDTLYSAGVFDLDAGPVTITLPDAGKRFMSLQIISQDHYATTLYGMGAHTFTHCSVGTRYMIIGVRIFVDQTDPRDLDQVHTLQDEIEVHQKSTGTLELPDWDPASRKRVHDALLVLGSTLTDLNRAFGTRDQVDPMRHLIGTAVLWGGNPDKDATYLNVTPDKNDGSTIYKLNVKGVPVDAFWSISIYNAQGYFQKNGYDAYTLNDITAKKGDDGSITVQFGGCDGKIANCLPTMAGWNYTVRLYRPRSEILNGSWIFPKAQVMP